jgi:hypothetical protein
MYHVERQHSGYRSLWYVVNEAGERTACGGWLNREDAEMEASERNAGNDPDVHNGGDDCDDCGEMLDRCTCGGHWEAAEGTDGEHYIGEIPLEGDASESQSVRALAEFWRLVDATWPPKERLAMSSLLSEGLS